MPSAAERRQNRSRTFRSAISIAFLLTAIIGFQIPTVSIASAALTCAQGGTCVVGDTGPGGGKVFYVAASTFACGPAGALSCKYLEVAPKTWSGAGTDPTANWGTHTYNLTGISSYPYFGTGGLGRGYLDSEYILQWELASSASGISRAYRGGSLADWYLPSSTELNVLCKYARGVTSDIGVDCTGGTTSPDFSSSNYWATSQGDYNKAYVINFSTGVAIAALNTNLNSVRPIRSFLPLKGTPDIIIGLLGGGTTAIYRKSTTVTIASSTAGKFTLRANGKPVPRCINLSIITSRDCPFSPSSHGRIGLTVTFIPTDIANFVQVTSSVMTIGVAPRQLLR